MSLKGAEEAYQAARQLYGEPFCNDWGWAAQHLSTDGRRFSDLEEAAKRSSMRPVFKTASYNIHAGVKGIRQRLGLMGQPGLLGGASNAGFTEPAKNTAYSLVHITTYLYRRPWSLDRQIEIQSLLSLRDQVPRAFHAAARELAADDEKIKPARDRRSKPASHN